MTFWQVLACAAVGYLLGNIQTGLIIGKLTGNVDLRKHGSGGSGATNALRVLGRKQGLMTLLGDMLKGVVATSLCLWIGGGRLGGMVGAACCVAGHIWPAFYAFKGGKGAATSIGVLAVLFPLYTLIMLAIGALVIWRAKMVSLGTLCAAVVFVIEAAADTIAHGDPSVIVFALCMAAMVFFAHRGNIRRLLDGNENKLKAEMFQKKT